MKLHYFDRYYTVSEILEKERTVIATFAMLDEAVDHANRLENAGMFTSLQVHDADGKLRHEPKTNQ